MKKMVIILYVVVVALAVQAAVDSSAVAIKDTIPQHHKKNIVDSTKIKPKKAAKDTSITKTQMDSILSKPDSVQKFVDKNGDGFNDNAPDHDGDGIPDALDKDYWALKEKNQPKPEEGAPPSVLGLDQTPGKALLNGNSEHEKRKPGIKFNVRNRRDGKR